MKIITVSDIFLDIDGYAGMVAYAELCNLRGYPAQAVCPAPTNASITNAILSWPTALQKSYKNRSSEDTFTVVDISDPKYFSSFVKVDSLDEVIDHHPGFESFWHDKIGRGAQIEPVGAVCTLVFERWQAENRLKNISQTSARLLVCGILDNCLNFRANITTKRDVSAYKSLQKVANLPSTWPKDYFLDVQQTIMSKPVESLENDTKIVKYTDFGGQICVGQLAVWDGSRLLAKYKAELMHSLSLVNANCYLNVLSLGDAKSYFVCKNQAVKEWLETLLGVVFVDDTAAADRLWLRKEIAHKSMGRPN